MQPLILVCYRRLLAVSRSRDRSATSVLARANIRLRTSTGSLRTVLQATMSGASEFASLSPDDEVAGVVR